MKVLGTRKSRLSVQMWKNDGRNSTPFLALPQGRTERNCFSKAEKKTAHPYIDSRGSQKDLAFLQNWAPETESFGRIRRNRETVWDSEGF